MRILAEIWNFRTAVRKDAILYVVLPKKQAIGQLFIGENVGNVIEESVICLFLLLGNKCSFIINNFLKICSKKTGALKIIGLLENILFSC